MFGLGISECITILLVMIVIINPKDLPKISKKIGYFYGSCVKHWNGFKKTIALIDKEIEDYAKVETENSNLSKSDELKKEVS